MNHRGGHRGRLFAGLFMAGVAQHLVTPARAQMEPQWLRMSIPQASMSMEVESLTEDTRIGGVKSSYEELTLTPLLGLRTSGSIYHPNLLTFDLSGEGGWGWDDITSRSPGVTQTRNESDKLLRYLAQVNILAAKPYNASFFADQDHTYRDYGPFSTFTVDSSRYGGHINWTTDNLSLYLDVGRREEQDSGLTDFSQLAETYVNFNLTQKRHSGQTALTYRLDEFDTSYNSGANQTSVNNSVGVSDSEAFGSRKQITAATSTSYSESDYGGQGTKTVTANENITANHRPNLNSYFSLDYSHSSMSSASASRLQGLYGVRHQLYESLTSSLDVHGSYEDNASSSSASVTDRYGLGLAENYTKRLGDWGRLTIGLGVVADHEDDNSSGTILTSFGESHQLYLTTSVNYRPVYLNNPRVIVASIEVRGPGGVLAQENLDYQLIAQGELTEIQLVQTSAILHDGDTVTVDYQSDSLNNASYESLNTSVQIRLDLFGKFGVYGRMNSLANNAPATALTETLTDLVGGVDYTWRWVRAGAEYEDYDSSFSQYQAWRFFQALSFRPSDDSTLSVNLNQMFYRYSDNRDQTQYQFLSRYNVQLLYSLAWYVEGGYAIQDVQGTEELLGSARSGLSWSRGKLSIRTGYEYNSQYTTSSQWTQEVVRNRFNAYLKRTF